MEALETFLRGLNILEVYGLVFIFYFGVAAFINKIHKRKFNFLKNIISALVGLLFFVLYMTFFAN